MKKIVAVIPANEVDDGKTLLAHSGSTYGGLVVGKEFANTNGYKWIFAEMKKYFEQKEYETVELRFLNATMQQLMIGSLLMEHLILYMIFGI